jgi:hypothetical protein
MAAPTYSEDLTDIDLAESGSTGWTAFNISGGGGGAPAFGADLGMQGAGAWDKPCSNAERGLAVNKTPGTGTVAAGVHIFVWGFCATPGITDNLATRGAYVIIGTSTTNFMQFHVEGNDTYGAAGRVGRCYPVDYHTTANTGSIPYATSNGTPGATPTYFGYGLKTTATAKGSNIGCDAIRYGTGAYITAGDGTTPATFAGFNAQNDSINNRWGILTDLGGTYEWQGYFVVGQDNTGTPTAAHFDDSSGATITLVDTVHSASDFTRLVIDHSSTVFNLTGATFIALGTINPGTIIINDASSSSTGFNACVFNGLGAIGGHTNIDFIGCTFIGCDVITTSNNDMSTSIVQGYEGAVDSSALIWNNAADPNGKLDDMVFTMGTAATHGIEFGLTSPTTITFNNLTFNGYGADTTTSAALYFARTSGTVTVNYSGTAPTYKSAGATINLVATVDVNVHIEDKDQTDIENVQVGIYKNPSTAYTSGAGNTAGDGDLVLTQTIDADVPQTSWAIVYDVSENLTLPYRFTSHDGANTLTFPTSVTGSATSTGSSTSLISTSTNFLTADIEEGDTIRNTTTGAYAVIDEIVDADNITTSSLSSGSWSSSDGFSIHDLATTLVSGTDIIDIPLALGQTDVNGDLATLSYKSSEVPTAVTVRARYSGTGTKYISGKQNGTITASGLSINITLQEDTEA